MKPFTVYRNPWHFYLAILFFEVCLCVLGAIPLIVLRDITERAFDAKDLLILVFTPVCFAIAVYLPILYFKIVPVIRYDAEKISFNNRSYSWQDIERVELTSRTAFRFLGVTQYLHGSVFCFKDGKEQKTIDMYYLNIDKLKRYVVEKLYYVRTDTSIVKVTRADVKYEFFDTYDGYLFFSMRGISFCLFLTFFLDAIRIRDLALLITMFGITLLHSWLLYYFKVSDYYLVVKNHVFIWPPKRYRLSDIREVSFDTYGKMPNFLRVVTRDFKYRMFPAGTLRERDWREMKAKLESNGVIVKDYIRVGS